MTIDQLIDESRQLGRSSYDTREEFECLVKEFASHSYKLRLMMKKAYNLGKSEEQEFANKLS